MSAIAELPELFFLLDGQGSVIVYQENETSWAGVLAFSSEQKARAFVTASSLEVSETAAISTDDDESIAALVRQVKTRAVRNLLLDLDYKTGVCSLIEFDGDRLGSASEWRFAPPAKS